MGGLVNVTNSYCVTSSALVGTSAEWGLRVGQAAKDWLAQPVSAGRRCPTPAAQGASMTDDRISFHRLGGLGAS